MPGGANNDVLLREQQPSQITAVLTTYSTDERCFFHKVKLRPIVHKHPQNAQYRLRQDSYLTALQ